MEMHQVRYFLAVARVLNFTRAAEECHVAQPSLTRAVKHLEDELGGELFRRERNLSHLTEFGQRMLPFLQQCYDSATAAKSLASSLKSGAVAPLSLALSRSVNVVLIVPQLTELTRVFPGLELNFLRGNRDEVSDLLKKGEVEIAVAGPFSQCWDRLDSTKLFRELFKLAVNSEHPFASRHSVDARELDDEHILSRTYCELHDDIAAFLKDSHITPAKLHRIASEHDYVTMIEAGLGMGMLPESVPASNRVKRMPIEGLNLTRTIYVHTVSGRQRSAAAAALIKLLRACDWTPYSEKAS